MRPWRAAAVLSLLALIGAAGLVAARLIWPRDSHELADLAAAVGRDLPFEARLTGGFQPLRGGRFVPNQRTALVLSPPTHASP